MKKYVLSICLGFYLFALFIVPSVCPPAIMANPLLQCLWLDMILLAGLVMFLVSAVLVFRKMGRKQVPTQVFVTALLCLVVIPACPFGYRPIERRCHRLVYSLVIGSNTELAESALRDYTEGETFTIPTFRYPLYRLPIAHARRGKGVLFLVVPGTSLRQDVILYDPTNKHRRGYHLGGAWWLIEGYYMP